MVGEDTRGSADEVGWVQSECVNTASSIYYFDPPSFSSPFYSVFISFLDCLPTWREKILVPTHERATCSTSQPPYAPCSPSLEVKSTFDTAPIPTALRHNRRENRGRKSYAMQQSVHSLHFVYTGWKRHYYRSTTS